MFAKSTTNGPQQVPGSKGAECSWDVGELLRVAKACFTGGTFTRDQNDKQEVMSRKMSIGQARAESSEGRRESVLVNFEAFGKEVILHVS